MEQVELIAKIMVGWVLMILGFSFGYKCFRAAVYGKMTYWSGFLPISIISPFFVHIPARPGTLIKETTGLWVHFLIGPIFLICAVLLLALGGDLAGFPGTDTLNLIIGGGNPLAPPAIIYNKNNGFSFPIFSRVAGKFGKSFNTVLIPLSEDSKLFPNQQADPEASRKRGSF